MDPIKLREERAAKVHKAREIEQRATREKRELTPEENAEIDNLLKAAKDLLATIERLEAIKNAEASLGDPADPNAPPVLDGPGGAARDGAPSGAPAGGQRSHRGGPPVRLGQDGASVYEQRGNPRHGTAEYRAAFGRWCVDGTAAFSPQERRDLSAGNDIGGGYMVAPTQFVAELIRDVQDECILRGLCRGIPLTGAASVSFPTQTSRMSDAEWTAEVKTGSKDEALAFGQRTLTPQPLAKRALVSEPLLRLSAISPDQLVREALAEVLGITLENGLMNGNGVKQPLGLFFPSSDGIPTSRDYSTHNTTTAIAANALIGAKRSLKQQYQRSASTRWVFHRDVVAQIEMLKDNNDQYLWRAGLEANAPDKICGIPVEQSEYAPNVMTAGQYVGILGDFKHYWIVELLAMRIQRLDELYAETNQIGFIARMEIDGGPTKAEAFTRIKLAAS